MTETATKRRSHALLAKMEAEKRFLAVLIRAVDRGKEAGVELAAMVNAIERLRDHLLESADSGAT